MRKTQHLSKIALVIVCSFLEQNQMKGQKGDPQKVKVKYKKKYKHLLYSLSSKPLTTKCENPLTPSPKSIKCMF